MLTEWTSDLRHAARALRRTPGFTLTAVGTLALAIGAVAGMFSVVDAVLLHPLPYAHPDRLVYIAGTAPGSDMPEEFEVADEFYLHYREQSRLLEDVSTFNSFTATLRAGERVERIRMSAPTNSLFSTLGARPMLGRLPVKEDESNVVVISNALWRTWFGARLRRARSGLRDRGRAPHRDRRDGARVQVPQRRDHALDCRRDPGRGDRARSVRNGARGPHGAWGDHRNSGGRAHRPGATTAGAVRRLGGVRPADWTASRRRPPHPGPAPRFGVPQSLWVLLGAVGIVLLIACANVANLFMVRAEGRHRDLAVRRAIGASRSQLVRLQMAEA